MTPEPISTNTHNVTTYCDEHGSIYGGPYKTNSSNETHTLGRNEEFSREELFTILNNTASERDSLRAATAVKDAEIERLKEGLVSACAECNQLRAENERLERKIEMIDKNHKSTLESDSIFASCDCDTKTPDIQYHKPGCKFRLITERDTLKAENERLTRDRNETVNELIQTTARVIAERDSLKAENERLTKERTKFFWELGQIVLTINDDGKIQDTGWSESHKAVVKLKDERDSLRARCETLEAALESIGTYMGEGGPNTLWQEIVRDLGQTARNALIKSVS